MEKKKNTNDADDSKSDDDADSDAEKLDDDQNEDINTSGIFSCHVDIYIFRNGCPFQRVTRQR